MGLTTQSSYTITLENFWEAVMLQGCAMRTQDEMWPSQRSTVYCRVDHSLFWDKSGELRRSKWLHSTDKCMFKCFDHISIFQNTKIYSFSSSPYPLQRATDFCIAEIEDEEATCVRNFGWENKTATRKQTNSPPPQKKFCELFLRVPCNRFKYCYLFPLTRKT